MSKKKKNTTNIAKKNIRPDEIISNTEEKKSTNENTESGITSLSKEEDVDNETTLLTEGDNVDNATTLLAEEEDVDNATTLLTEDEDVDNATTLLTEDEDVDNATTLLSEDEDLDNATTLLSEEDDENATTLLSEVIDIKDKNVEIVNIISQERTKIEKIPFVLGSNKKETDYFIDNATVSKKHAIIYFENDIFYIVDNKSTNGTLVEGMAIEPNKKTELCNGNLIQLSNELIQINIH